LNTLATIYSKLIKSYLMKSHLITPLVALRAAARRMRRREDAQGALGTHYSWSGTLSLSLATATLALATLAVPQAAQATTARHHKTEQRVAHKAVVRPDATSRRKVRSTTAIPREALKHAATRRSRVVESVASRREAREVHESARRGGHQVYARLDPRHPHRGRGRHAIVRNVAFTPAHPTYNQAFGLHDGNDGALALRSSVAYVVDQNTLEPLYDKNSQAVLPIASITKLMTAMVALDAKLPLTQMLEVTDEDRDYEKGTGSRLSVGSVLSREDMLHIALMASENRAAAALSRYYPGGRPAFLAAMNVKAQQLGMTDTHFVSPTGLTSQNVSNARDLAKMVAAAYRYPLIRQYSTDRAYEVFTGRKTISYHSTNALIRNPTWEIGLQKTGFINEAGECLVMQTVLHSRPVIMVLLDSTGKYSHFADATRLRSWLDQGGVQRVTSADNSSPGT
jgi:D-alanyl-D-alanine endopeptidase (penicillin-binding protein 7)